MNMITSLSEYHPDTPLVLSIGMFDSVHLGHQSIIKTLNTIAQSHHLKSGILSFWPHPRLVFNPEYSLKLLNTIEEKTELLDGFGLDVLCLQDFNESFRTLSAEDFVKKVLVEQLNVKHLIIGYDHRFGKNQAGDFSLLQKMAPQLGFTVQQLEAIALENQNISSTKIREALKQGKINDANAMLGYPYMLRGKVIHGKKLGRTIGYPTANLEIDPQKLLPKNGAYIVEVYIDRQFYKGMMSIGTNPTVEGKSLSTEVYILDFDEDIYGKEIQVKFRDFLHEEIKFDGLEALIEKLDEDKLLTEQFEF